MFREIKPDDLTMNPFRAIGKDWMLVTVANGQTANLMTASWGGFGVLWNKPVATVYIRPCRYTLELMDRESAFSLAFLDEGYREQYKICGTKSGREIDKAAVCGLDIVAHADTPYVAQARTVLFCRKLYRQVIESGLFVYEKDREEQTFEDVMYVAEVETIFVK